MMNPKLHLAFSVIFLVFGVFVGFNLLSLTSQLNQANEQIQDTHHHIVAQIDCNDKLIAVLQKRGEARLVVDGATRGAMDALVSMLEDIREDGGMMNPEDPHVIQAIDQFRKASNARAQFDLSASYPDCR